MNKSELINALSEETNFSKKDIASVKVFLKKQKIRFYEIGEVIKNNKRKIEFI